MKLINSIIFASAIAFGFSSCASENNEPIEEKPIIDSPSSGDNNKPDAEKPTIDYTRLVNEHSSKWISEIIEYHPAPGQFVNGSVGDIEASKGIVGKTGMVTLGGFGGYIVFKFDHTIINQEGADFVIHGNAFDGSSEPGAVMVAMDKNGNGKPDADEWLELKGSDYDQSTKDYQITYSKPSQTEKAEDVLWKDNKGGKGQITAIVYHQQCYYPLFFEGNPKELTYTGNLIASTSSKKGTIYRLRALEWGYVDNFSKDYPTVVNNDPDTKNSNKFDLSNAINKEGKSVSLKGADFIKVYNCLNQESGWIGEASTEVCGAISLTKKVK